MSDDIFRLKFNGGSLQWANSEGEALTLQNANGVPVWVANSLLDKKSREEIAAKIAEGKCERMPILNSDEHQVRLTQAGTCWACEKQGNDLAWWDTTVCDDGGPISNVQLSYLIHRECINLAAKKRIDAEGRVRHDGKLDEDAHIAYGEIRKLGFKQGLMLFDGSVICDLTAKQALSLLAWLLQERANLEELARELKEDTVLVDDPCSKEEWQDTGKRIHDQDIASIILKASDWSHLNLPVEGDNDAH